MKIYGCQLDSVWENKAANFAKAEKLIAGAKAPPGSLVLLPEMFATGFSMNVASIAEPPPQDSGAGVSPAAPSSGAGILPAKPNSGARVSPAAPRSGAGILPAKPDILPVAPASGAGSPTGRQDACPTTQPSSETADFLSRTARQFGIYLMGGLVTVTKEGRGQNQAAVFSSDGKEIARYTKCQPFSLGGESQHYEAGRETMTFQWQDCLVAPFICYDLRFPELFRAAARRQAELFTVIASWPIKRIHHWVTLLQARAIENQAYVIGVNRTGADPKYVHNGRSLIVNPHGEILADAGTAEGVISADIDMAALRAWRSEFPALQDMRAGEAWRAMSV